MLTIENLEYSYGKIKALNGISATVNTGEIVSIVGANGAGKSTLMRCIAGLLKPKSGEILYDGKPLPHTPHEISLVPEGRWIFPNLSVEENLLMGGYLVKDRSVGIARSFAMFPRLEERRHQRAGTLSGGEQQMLAIARGLMSDPKLLLLDEHTAALDPATSAKVLQLSDRIIHEHGLTALMVTHNMQDAITYGNRLVMMNQGKIILDIKGEEKNKLTIEDLLHKFEDISGSKFASDSVLLGDR